MPSSLRYFCCACGGKDAKADYTIYPKVPKRKRNKSKLSSGSSTFTRRRLLDNEQTEHQSNGGLFQQMVFHTQSKDLSRETSFDNHEVHDSAAKLINGKARNKRRKVQEIFPSESNQNNISRTTFPWMDENFVPNASSNIRLGISSVQMHARRKLSGGSDSLQPEAAVNFNPNAQNHTDDDKLQEANNKNAGYNLKFKSHSADCYDEEPSNKNENQTKTASRSVSMKEDRKVKSKHKAPKSDIGVRQIKRTQSGYKGDKQVPKLDDLKCLPATDVSHLARPQRRTQAGSQNIFNKADLKSNKVASQADASFSSSVSFPTNHSVVSERPQKSKQPLTVVPRPNSQKSSQPMPSQPFQDSPNGLSIRESMYGYIPKIVQSVQASNALEGSKIDDFFMNCLNENELNSFASAQEIQTPRSQYLSASPNVQRSSSFPMQVEKGNDQEHAMVKLTKSENGTEISSIFETQQVTVDFGSQDSLDADSVFTDSHSLRKKLFALNDKIKIESDTVESLGEDTEQYSTLDKDHTEIPFIDQEPDLIQSLKNVNVADQAHTLNNNEQSTPGVVMPDKEVPWEHTFSSQLEYIESIPLKIPCQLTPPLSRKGETMSVFSRNSNKTQAANTYWLSNVDSEVLY